MKRLACVAGGFVGVWWPAAEPRKEWGQGRENPRPHSSYGFNTHFYGSAAGHQTPTKPPATQAMKNPDLYFGQMTNESNFIGMIGIHMLFVICSFYFLSFSEKKKNKGPYYKINHNFFFINVIVCKVTVTVLSYMHYHLFQ